MATVAPGGVTSNVVGSTYHPQTAEQAAMDRQLLERQWQLEDRNWGLAREKDAKALAEWQKGEAEAKMKKAYEMFYAPYAQGQWDRQQGQMGGLSPGSGLVSGNQQPGYQAYKKGGNNAFQSGASIGRGQSPYEYRPDTNMPANQYQQGLDYMYEMWKAGQMMGAKDWKQYGGYPGRQGPSSESS